MTPDKVIYTDGRDVVVTDSTLKVKNTSYKLNGITKLSFWTIRAERWPGILLLLIGLTAAVCGYLKVLPSTMDIQAEAGVYDINSLALWTGVILALIGFLILVSAKERYAVRIGTAEGEKNAIVSRKREYIAQIVDAIHSAFDLGPHSPTVVASKE
jgi:hypothetical protein